MAGFFRPPVLAQVIPQVARLVKQQMRVGLVFIDLVDFTSFQEEYGRRTGDMVLAAVRRMLKEDRFPLGKTTGILPSTLGGDDFLLFFPGPGPRESLIPQLKELRERIQGRLHEVAQRELHRIGRSGRPLQIHLGYAEVTCSPERRPEMCVYEAVKEAALMAKSGMDPADFLSREEIVAIIQEERVHSVYQPIVSLHDGSVVGYEALARGPAGTRFASPMTLFELAAQHHLLFRLEALCRKRAIEGAAAFLRGQKLFLNIDPRVLHDPDFRTGTTRVLLEHADLSPEDVVLELTERSAIGDYHGFREALAHYRRQGYTLAIDDVGSGYSSLQAIVELQPLYVKIDRSIIRGVPQHPVRRAMVKALVQLAHELHCYTIAEGVEDLDELDFLLGAAVDYAQGYLFAHPAAPPACVPPDLVGKLRSGTSGRPAQSPQSPEGVRFPVRDLVSPAVFVSPDEPVERALDLFSRETHLRSLVVARSQDTARSGDAARSRSAAQSEGAARSLSAAQNEDAARPQALGLVMKERLIARLASRYGYALFANKPVGQVMERELLTVDSSTPIEQVARAVASRAETVMNDDVLVTENGRLAGTVAVRAIIERMAQIQIEDARNANPLTGLPGNLTVEATLKARFESGCDLAVLYVDLDNFKAFNDRYGFERGDRVIVMTARILSSVVSELGNATDLVGHIGGDDFVIITTPDRAEDISSRVVSLFDTEIPGQYDPHDRARGYVVTMDRNGRPQQYPIMAVSVAVVPTPPGATSHVRFAEVAAELKCYLKRLPGSKFLVDRRRSA